ncbi:MAG: OmpH family outer membrane protein [Polyangiaceae bacterium]|nr:OmpH family outer membrane protein [Polyangiaceae bacterium]MCW5789631.1 OmpH family outer membrane protein [Polyangiaceae bacterium]
MSQPLQRFIVSLLTCLALSGLGSTAFAMKIGVIDTQRAIMETEDGLRAQATLKKLFDKRQRELDKKQRDLQAEKEQIEKQRGVLSKAAYQKRAEKWQQDMVELQQVFVEYNKELQKTEGQLTRPIYRKAMGLIRRLATSGGFDMVLDKQAAPYFRADLDLTDRLIQLYNEGGAGDEEEPKAPAGKAAPKPAAKPAAKAPAPAKAPAAAAKAPAATP